MPHKNTTYPARRPLFLLLLLSFALYVQAQHPYTYLRIEGIEMMMFGPSQQTRFGAMNKRGEVAIPPKYAALSDFGPEGAVAVQDTTYGFVFRNGRERWFPELQKLYRLSEGLAPAQKGGKWGFIDKKGHTVIPFLYEMAFTFHEGYAAVRLDKRWKMVDKKGNYLLHDRFTFANYPVYAGITVFSVTDSVSGTSKKGMVNIQGKIVVPAIYDEVAGYFADGLCWVHKGNQEGFVDEKGAVVFLFDGTIPQRSFNNGLTVAVQKGRVGYLNRQGQVVIPFEYDGNNSNNFSEGLAAVSKTGKMGFINPKNEVVIPLAFGDKASWASSFKQGRAAVQDAATGQFGYVDTTGRMVVSAIYDEATPFSSGFAPVKKGGKVGLIDLLGHEIVPCEYLEVWPYEGGLARFAIPK